MLMRSAMSAWARFCRAAVSVAARARETYSAAPWETFRLHSVSIYFTCTVSLGRLLVLGLPFICRRVLGLASREVNKGAPLVLPLLEGGVEPSHVASGKGVREDVGL